MNFLKKSRAFGMVVLILFVGLVILTYSQIPFVFRPLEAVISSAFVPVLIATFIYYLFLPVFNLIEKRTGSKKLALYTTMLLIFFVVYLAMSQLTPQLIAQTAKFVGQIPLVLGEAVERIDHSVIEQWAGPLLEDLDINRISSTMIQLISGATSGISSLISFISKSAIFLFTVPLLVFYLFKDGHQFSKFLLSRIPVKYKALTEDFFADFHQASSAYIGGKLLVCLYVGVASYLMFTFLGLPNALLLGFVCGFADIIPYFGPFIGAAPAFLVALTQDSQSVLILVIGIVLIQFGESYLVSPLVMRKALDVHPILVIFLLLIGGNLFGLLGMILILPVYSIVIAMYHSLRKFQISRRQDLY